MGSKCGAKSRREEASLYVLIPSLSLFVFFLYIPSPTPKKKLNLPFLFHISRENSFEVFLSLIKRRGGGGLVGTVDVTAIKAFENVVALLNGFWTCAFRGGGGKGEEKGDLKRMSWEVDTWGGRIDLPRERRKTKGERATLARPTGLCSSCRPHVQQYLVRVLPGELHTYRIIDSHGLYIFFFFLRSTKRPALPEPYPF